MTLFIKHYLILIAFLINFSFVHSQTKKNSSASTQHQKSSSFKISPENKISLEKKGVIRCATVENEYFLQKKYPNRLSNSQFEKWLGPKIEDFKKSKNSGKLQKTTIEFNIPVVVHVIHDGDPINTPGNINGENISDAQIISQIKVLNEDFRRLTNTNGGANTTGLAQDIEINFCLAEQDANGDITTGIVRHNITPYTNDEPNGAGGADWETFEIVADLKTNTIWDPTKYLNIWTMRFGGLSLDDGGLSDLLGFAQFPGSSTLSDLSTNSGIANTDGVVINFNALGTEDENDTSFTLNGTYNLGRTTTHEIGHWLGLRHIWGDKANDTDDGCLVDDYCSDTPNAEAANYSCNLTNDSCPDLVFDMVQNYMDYTPDACMDTFTQDQKDRMVTVMQNSPRRKELDSSIGCDTAIPAIRFINPNLSINEGTNCSFVDYEIPLRISAPPSQDATITFTINNTSLTEGDDFDILTPSVQFNLGETIDKNFIVRIYVDSFIEVDESITVGMSISTTGDAFITTTSNTTFTLNVADDDTRYNGITTIFNDDFESYENFTIDPIGGWTMNDLDGNYTYNIINIAYTNQAYKGTFIVFNASQTSPTTSPNWDPHGGQKGYYCFDATSNPSGTAVNNDYIFTPQINLNGTASELKFWAKSFTADYGLERLTIKVSNSDTSVGSFTTINPVSPTPGPNSYQEIPTTWTEYTYDLSAFDGQQIYIAFHVTSADAFALMLDDVSIATDIQLVAQTDINTPDENQLNKSGTILTKNDANDNLLVDITNVNGKDYDCVSTNVSRAFSVATPALQETTPGISNYVMAKQFSISPTTIHSDGNATLIFYFTEQEISAWEAATGNVRGDITVIKNNGGTKESVAPTLGNLGSNISLSANFSTGINGTYSFGKASALSVYKSEFKSFSIYPNPTENKINIEVSTSEDVSIKLFDFLGRKVYDKIHSNNSLFFNASINLKLSKGIYLLSIESDSKKSVKKLIIN